MSVGEEKFMFNDYEVLVDWFNVEFVIFKGCLFLELGMIVGLVIVVWLFFSLLLVWLFGVIIMGFGIVGVGVVVMVVVLVMLF